MTTQKEISEWFKRGQREKDNTHMIIVCDTFDYEDYPVFVKSTEDVKEREKHYNEASMQRVMEVYNLKKPMVPQLAERRSFNY